tara:strand:+ start:552 stop:743 length:192 start_codon:yes stop_codon:yes gene_type:complete
MAFVWGYKLINKDMSRLTQYWINKRSKIVWSVDIVDDETVFIWRLNQSKIITKECLSKNWIKK